MESGLILRRSDKSLVDFHNTLFVESRKIYKKENTEERNQNESTFETQSKLSPSLYFKI